MLPSCAAMQNKTRRDRADDSDRCAAAAECAECAAADREHARRVAERVHAAQRLAEGDLEHETSAQHTVI